MHHCYAAILAQGVGPIGHRSLRVPGSLYGQKRQQGSFSRHIAAARLLCSQQRKSIGGQTESAQHQNKTKCAGQTSA
jgi:hypothetical protein